MQTIGIYIVYTFGFYQNIASQLNLFKYLLKSYAL